MANNKKTKKGHTGTAKVKKVDVPMTKKEKIFTLVASLLIVAIVATAAVFIIRGIRGVHVDYMKVNLSKYISLSEEDFSNIVIDIPLDEYDEGDLISRINRILAENKSAEPKYNGGAYKSEAITLGDIVSMMYRGYYVNDEGKTVEISSNFGDGKPVQIEVGSGKVIGEEEEYYFIAGFTDNMLGIVPSDYAPFAIYNEGSVQEGDVIYLSYVAFYPDSSYKQVTAERIDLSEDIDAIYGEGFKAYILGTKEGTEVQKIGTALKDAKFPYDSGSAGYSEMKIEYVTRGCESAPLSYNVTFPANYSEESLRGVEATFDIYISNAIIYDTPELNEAFITDTLKLTAADLEKYEGADLVAKYKNSLIESIKTEYETSNEEIIIDAVWDVLFEKVEVKKLPKRNVSDYYDSYYSDIEYYYSLYTSSFSSIDYAAYNYLNISQGVDWREYLQNEAERTATEQIIFYYVIREAGFVPKKAEFQEMRNDIIEAHYQYHIDLNSEELAKLSGDAYDNRVAEIKKDVLAYYGEEYFDENVYYNYGMDKIIENFVTIK